MVLTRETTSAQLDTLHDLLDAFRVLSDNGRLDFSRIDAAAIEEIFQLVDRVESCPLSVSEMPFGIVECA